MSFIKKEIINGFPVYEQWWMKWFDDPVRELVLYVLSPNIMSAMRKIGLNFSSQSRGTQFDIGGEERRLTFDMFLDGEEGVMPIKVTTHLRECDVAYHLKELKLLREYYSVSHRVTGKMLYSGIAGLEIDEGAREMALGLGMYVIEMVEDTKYVNIVKPTAELGKW